MEPTTTKQQQSPDTHKAKTIQDNQSIRIKARHPRYSSKPNKKDEYESQPRYESIEKRFDLKPPPFQVGDFLTSTKIDSMKSGFLFEKYRRKSLYKSVGIF